MLRITVAAFTALTVAACASNTTSAASTTAPAKTNPSAVTPPPSGTPATCMPQQGPDLILWTRAPGAADDSALIGWFNYALCKPEINSLDDITSAGFGYCTEVAKPSDNPGYVTDVRPAPPPRHVLAESGDSCP